MKTAFCFDFDGTVTKEELLPLIAKEAGIYDEIEALTEATIKGIIPFNKSFMLRCRLLADINPKRVSDVVREVGLYSNIVDFIKSYSDDCFIITGNLDVWVSSLIKDIGCDYFCSTADVQNNKLIGVSDIIDKGASIAELREKYDRIVAVGDGMGDVAMFENADVGIAFGATHHPVVSLIEVSDYVVFDEVALCTLLEML